MRDNCTVLSLIKRSSTKIYLKAAFSNPLFLPLTSFSFFLENSIEAFLERFLGHAVVNNMRFLERAPQCQGIVKMLQQ